MLTIVLIALKAIAYVVSISVQLVDLLSKIRKLHPPRKRLSRKRRL
jgi:hypothetical protein